MVSVALYNLTLAGDSPNLGVTHHLEVIRADGQLTSHAGLVPSICPPYVFVSPNFTPWYGGASQWFKETCSASPPAAVMVVMAVGIEPGLPIYKPCLLTTTLWQDCFNSPDNIIDLSYLICHENQSKCFLVTDTGKLRLAPLSSFPFSTKFVICKGRHLHIPKPKSEVSKNERLCSGRAKPNIRYAN